MTDSAAPIDQPMPGRASASPHEFGGSLVLTGMPGAGKTTVSRLISAKLPRAACINGDMVNALLVSGWGSFINERGEWDPDETARRQLWLCKRNICSLADNFVESGFTPVIDTVIADCDELSEFAGMLRSPLLLVVLAPSLEVCRHRNATRAVEERVSYDFSHLKSMKDEFGEVGWWLDSGDLTAEATADLIIAQATERAAVTV